jgi:hypothetical protein
VMLIDKVSQKPRDKASATGLVATGHPEGGLWCRARDGGSQSLIAAWTSRKGEEGPSAARTLASEVFLSRRDFGESFEFIRGAREHCEEGPLARGARQGVQMDSAAGEPSKPIRSMNDTRYSLETSRLELLALG